MYSKILIPLDGSKTAEAVLPHARYLAAKLRLNVELLAVIDVVELARSVSAAEGMLLNRLVADEERRSGVYLDRIANTFAGLAVHSVVQQGNPADLIIEAASADKDTLIAMATHGRSGLGRFLLGSVAEKVLRAAAHPVLLVRASEAASAEGQRALKSVLVPLDGSKLAEAVLPAVEEVAKTLGLDVVLFRAYAVPYGAYSAGEGFYDPVNFEAFLARLREETVDYLERKSAELKRQGIAAVSYIAKEGLSADEIIKCARETPDNLVAMCSHGYSGVKRWMLGSVTETVVRHSGDPVLVLRARE